MTKIIGISGRKQSGKSTTANYINGDILMSRDMVQTYSIDEDGKLVIKTTNQEGMSGYGIFDASRKDKAFIEYAEKELWPFVKLYHFADTLKSIAVRLFDIPPVCVYGSDDDKNKKLHYNWEDMPTATDNTGPMSSREFLQYFGTTIVREINDNAWVNATIATVTSEGSSVALIPDVRFPNEVAAIKEAGGIVIRMERDPFSDDHKCESALDKVHYDWSNFDVVIPNSVGTIEELCEELSTHTSLWRQ
jgi:hypothetical protein